MRKTRLSLRPVRIKKNLFVQTIILLILIIGVNVPMNGFCDLTVSDIFYGKIHDFRQGLINCNLLYVMEIESKTIVFDQTDKAGPRKGRPKKNRQQKPETVSVKEFAKQIPAWRFKTICWREVSKGHLTSRFAAVRVQPAHGYQPVKNYPPSQWLIIEWPDAEAEPIKFWFSNLPPQAGLRCLVRLAKIRWKVEQNYQQQKDELGLDHYEGLGFLGWHRHVTMNMIA